MDKANWTNIINKLYGKVISTKLYSKAIFFLYGGRIPSFIDMGKVVQYDIFDSSLRIINTMLEYSVHTCYTRR